MNAVPWPSLLVVAGLASLLVLLLTPVARWVAFRYDVMDVPALPLKAHAKPVAYLGGVAMCLAFTAAAAVACVLQPAFRGPLCVLAGGVIAVTLLGLLDDIRGLPVWTRLAVQTSVAACLAGYGFRLQIPTLPGWCAVMLSVLWLVGITNAFNMIDVMDALAAGIAVIVGLALVAVSFLGVRPLAAFASAMTVGAALGFLRYNRAPARIHMGDAGSYMLGLSLGVSGLAAVDQGAWAGGLPVLVLVFGVPVAEVIAVTVLRIRNGRPVFRGSDDHIALRLVAAGASRAQAVLVLHLAGLVLAVAGMAVFLVKRPWNVCVCGVTVLVAALCLWRLCKVAA